ncbi:MAG: ABC transporter permease [Anaerolineae bacterium]|nr:ABC transporter permease [Anaerolineae bacterium]
MRATLNETYKGLLLLWDYRFNLVMETVAICFVFIGLNFLIGNGDLPQEQLDSSLLGYIVWLYTFMAVTNMGWSLREEAQTGTLEQAFMSPVRPQLLILGRALANFLTTSFTISLIVVVLVPLLSITVPIRLAGLVVFAWTVIGLFGLGFIVGGATLVFKQVESFAYLAQYGLMFLNGSMLPVDKLPDGIALFARLLPGTQGIVVLRSVLLDGHSLSGVWRDGSLGWLMLHSTIFFAVGWLLFQICEQHARRRGSLGQY